MNKEPFFEECEIYWRGGYYIPVRNSLNFHLQKEHISGEEKVLYEKEFGERILLDYEFLEWYVDLKRNSI